MTRDEILLAAAQIFRTKGFHATSMRDIAEAVSLKKGSLYHHVASKQEILTELLDKAMSLLNNQMEAICCHDDLPEIKFRKAVNAYISLLTEHRDLSAVLLLEYRSLDSKYRLQHQPKRDHFEGLWVDLISEGAKKDIFSVSNCSVMVKTILGSINWMITWYQPSGSLSPEEISENISDFFLNGLLYRKK